MDLEQIRQRIDAVDAQLIHLFRERMEIVQDVAAYKRANNLPVLHTDREQQVLHRVAALAGPDLAESARVLYTVLMDLSKAQQQRQLAEDGLPTQGEQSLPVTPTVACQGIDGAYSSIAARRLFPQGSLQFCGRFEQVFQLVQDGACAIGVLPIENSTAGSVNEVYDLMCRYQFHIVRSLNLEISHCLLALPGASLEGLREVHSHEQALHQCGDLFRIHPHLQACYAANTAMAAQMVAQRGDLSCGAIASAESAARYGLTILRRDICNVQRNGTRFIAISREPIVTPDANRISISLALPHEAGALHRLITQFAALGLNLTKLESRPIPGTDFEFLFYFDFVGSLDNPQIRSLLHSLPQTCARFTLLGAYKQL